MKLTTAVLGAGGWGSNWSERALRDPECEIRAIADSNPKVLDHLAARGIPKQRLFDNADEALDAGPTDIVTCSIPNPARVPYLLRALREGRHVLVDKPLVHTVEALKSLLEAGRERRSVFMVAQNYRHFAGARRVHDLLRGEALGPIASIHAHFLRNTRAVRSSYVRDLPGVLAMGLEMCIHHFDMMRYFLDALPVTVAAQSWRTPWSSGVGYDGLDVHLEFPGGAVVAYDASWGATYDGTDWNGHWEILAQHGTITYGARGRALQVHGVDGRPFESDDGPDASVDGTRSVDRVWALFKESVAGVQAGRAAPMDGFCPLEDNAKSLGIALAVARSVDTGAPLDYDAFIRHNGLIT